MSQFIGDNSEDIQTRMLISYWVELLSTRVVHVFDS